MDGKKLWESHLESLKNAIGPGAKEYKIDFHFHTPASKKDYKDKGASYEDIAKGLANKEIDAVFVTDHNCWEGISQLKQECEKIGRTKVFPGVELTLETQVMQLVETEGNKKKIGIAKFHCLALFPDTDASEDKIKSLITNDHTDEEILKKEPVDRVLKLSLEKVHEKVSKWGGLFIPAHLNQGKRASKSRSLDDIYADNLTLEFLEKYFHAVEIRKPESEKIFNGEFKTSSGDVVPKMSCVLGSDSHELATIGRKSSYLTLEELTFENIRSTLMHPSRVNVEKTFREINHIESVVINGSFIKNISIYFNHRINALIGAKGSGKTSIIEAIRFCLGYEAKEDKKSYLQHILGPAGTVSVIVNSQSKGRFLFHRKFSDTSPLVYAEDYIHLERDSIIPSVFNLSIASAGEITELAVDRTSQLDLIDNYESSGSIVKANKNILKFKSELPSLYKKYHEADKQFRESKKLVDELKIKEASLSKINSSEIKDLQDEKEKRLTEVGIIDNTLSAIESHEHRTITPLKNEIKALVESYLDKYKNGEITVPASAEKLSLSYQALQDKVNVFEEEMNKEVSSFLETFKNESTTIKEKTATADEKYQEEFNKLSAEVKEVLLKRNETTQELSKLSALTTTLDTNWEKLRKAIESLTGKLLEINENIKLRTSKRQETADSINNILQSSSSGSQLTFTPYGGSSGANSSYKKEEYYSEIAKVFDNVTKTNYTEKIFKILSSDLPSEYSAQIDDHTEVKFEIYPNTWKKSNQLSSGQKATSVLPLLLIAAKGPIILDQPEDNLDNKYIGTTTVKMFSARKGINQILMTSHNATLVVMTDADLIIEMEDQNSLSHAKRTGFLNGPNSNIKNSVLEVLDGGTEALEKRFVKYGIEVKK